MSNPFSAPPVSRIVPAIDLAGILEQLRPSNLLPSSHPALDGFLDVPAPTSNPRPALNDGNAGGAVAPIKPAK